MFKIAGIEVRSQHFIQGLVCLGLTLAMLSATSCKKIDPVVKIGLVAPFEGRDRSIGYDVIYSARFAIRDSNKNGGIGGRRVELVALDDFGSSEMATEIAASLVSDPDVLAVIGHWLPESSSAGSAIYDKAGLAFVSTNEVPELVTDPALLPKSFGEGYKEVSPFSEEVGPYAGYAFDAMNFVLAGLEKASEKNNKLDRKGVKEALNELTFRGMTGLIFQP